MQKKYRLKKNEDYQKVYAKGKTFACKYMVMTYVDNKNIQSLKSKSNIKITTNNLGLKVGFSVSKKIGKANVRNRFRRQIKEATRLLIPHIDPNYCIIISARTDIIKVEYKQISESIVYMLKKCGLWKE